MAHCFHDSFPDSWVTRKPGLSAEKVEEIISQEVSTGVQEYERLDLARTMKRVGISPYMFLRVAVTRIMHDDIPSALRWIEYARGFMDVYYDRLDEAEVFDVISDYILSTLEPSVDDGEFS
jgi:hypothetical protein